MKITEIKINVSMPVKFVNSNETNTGDLNIQYKVKLEDKDCPEEVTKEIVQRITSTF